MSINIDVICYKFTTLKNGESPFYKAKEQKRYGYAESIQQVYNSLLKFNKHLEILFSEMDIQWLKRYEL